MNRLQHRAAHLLAALAIAAFVAPPSPAPGETPRSLNQKGLAAYRSGDYDKALELFRKASQQAEDKPLLDYNAGVARAARDHDGDSGLAEALDDFSKASAAREPGIAQRARFAEGVVHHQLASQKLQAGDLESARSSAEAAMLANRDVLLSSPDDNDARVNFELSGRLLEQIEQQQQQQQQQQQDKDDQQKEQDQQQQESRQDQQQSEDQEQQQQDSSQQQDQKQQSEEQQQQQQDKQSEQQQSGEQKQDKQENRKPEDESRQQQQDQAQPSEADEDQGDQDASATILNVLDENDTEALKRMLERRYGHIRGPERDW